MLRKLLSDGGLSDTDDGSDDIVIISREINARDAPLRE